MEKRQIIILFLAVMVLSISCEMGTAPDLPLSPVSVETVGLSDSAILIRWTDISANEDSFLVRRSMYPDFSTVDFEMDVPADTEIYRDKYNIIPNEEYFYEVCTVKDGYIASACEVLYVETGDASPSPQAGQLVADHTVVNMIKNGEIPVSAITDAKNDLHIAYGHTSHGSQIISGMVGLAAFANAGNCDGGEEYSLTPDLFSWSHAAEAGSLHLYEGDGYGTGDLDHDCGYFSEGYTRQEYIDAVAAYDPEDPESTRPRNWEHETRIYLGDPVNGYGSNHTEINVIIWSWCGQASDGNHNTLAGMTLRYFEPMETLEAEYYNIDFVYMTGHLNRNGQAHAGNELIRAYCEENDKWLFDFADIESYDPDGIPYSSGGLSSSDSCIYDFNGNGTIEIQEGSETIPENGDRNWAMDWQDDHTMFNYEPGQPADWYNCGAAHSVSINSNMKAYAAWWLWCRIAGWIG